LERRSDAPARHALRRGRAGQGGGGGAAKAGKLRAESTPLHKGRRTHVWQTRVTDEKGRLLSLTLQTQMILE